MRRSLTLAFALAFLMPFASGQAAEEVAPAQDDAQIQRVVLRAGKYTFHVDVRNRWGQWINNARGRANVMGTSSANITVESDGYREARAYVSLRPNTTTYNVRVTLDDPTVWFDVVNEDRQPLQHYTREDHFGAWGDEFKFVSRIPAEGYTRFTSWDIEVRANHMIPFGDRIRVSDLGNYREIEVTIKRRDMTRWSNNIELRVPSDESLPEAPAAESMPTDSQSRYRKQAFGELHGPAE